MRPIVVAAALVVLAGCASVGNPFARMKPDYNALPAEAMRAVAKEIEAAVARGDREPKVADRGGVVVSTPEIQQAIRTRAARATLVGNFLDTGFAWERSNGLIAILRSREYKRAGASRDRDRNAVVVIGENQNRWTIYEGIIKASKLSPRALGAIQDIFHKARLEHLNAGQKYEDANGAVAVKGAAGK